MACMTLILYAHAHVDDFDRPAYCYGFAIATTENVLLLRWPRFYYGKIVHRSCMISVFGSFELKSSVRLEIFTQHRNSLSLKFKPVAHAHYSQYLPQWWLLSENFVLEMGLKVMSFGFWAEVHFSWIQPCYGQVLFATEKQPKDRLMLLRAHFGVGRSALTLIQGHGGLAKAKKSAFNYRNS